MRIDPRGFWLDCDEDHHVFDPALAYALAQLFGGATVYDFGCGPGRYVRYLRELGIDCRGCDGNPHTPAQSGGLCTVADLTRPLAIEPLPDWAMAIEVGEHIPADLERTFLENLHRHNRRGIVLSWAPPGQEGDGHVNLKTPGQVADLIEPLGYYQDLGSKYLLRAAARVAWLRSNLTVFRRALVPPFRAK